MATRKVEGRSSRVAAGSDAKDGDIRDLFSYNLQRLAGISTRIALLEIKPAFDLNMHDWRALAVLDYLGAAPLQTLSQRAGVLKSQMSRTVGALEKRELIARGQNPDDGRSTLLMLTAAGKAVVRDVLAASRERNDRMLAYLDADERKLLMALIEKATRGSVEVLDELRGRSGKRQRAETEQPRALYEAELI